VVSAVVRSGGVPHARGAAGAAVPCTALVVVTLDSRVPFVGTVAEDGSFDIALSGGGGGAGHAISAQGEPASQRAPLALGGAAVLLETITCEAREDVVARSIDDVLAHVDRTFVADHDCVRVEARVSCDHSCSLAAVSGLGAEQLSVALGVLDTGLCRLQVPPSWVAMLPNCDAQAGGGPPAIADGATSIPSERLNAKFVTCRSTPATVGQACASIGTTLALIPAFLEPTAVKVETPTMRPLRASAKPRASRTSRAREIGPLRPTCVPSVDQRRNALRGKALRVRCTALHCGQRMHRGCCRRHLRCNRR